MPVEAILTCWGNSHPFQERRMSLSEPAKIGRSVAQSRPTSSNAIFDCKVLSRNHALMWHDNGKFYLQDTKSSNGTFVNNQRLSKGTEESSPKEIFSNDILQFGVDVVENSRKVTHSCIIATLKLLDSDGREITKSSLSNDSSSVVVNNVQSHEFYQLLQYLQEALHREQLLESKLTVVQQLVQATQESTENNWQNLVNEEKLLSRLETLEKQLSICSKLQPDGSLQQELITLQNDKFHYESLAKNSLKKVIEEKIEAVKKLNDVERTLSNKEEECSHLKDVSQLIQTELNALSEKFQDQFKDLQNVQQQLQDSESTILNNKEEHKKETDALLAKIDDLLEEQERLQAKIESLQGETNFNNEQLNNVKAKMNSFINSNDDVNKPKFNKSSKDEGIQVDLVNLLDLHLLQSLNEVELLESIHLDSSGTSQEKSNKIANDSHGEIINQENGSGKLIGMPTHREQHNVGDEHSKIETADEIIFRSRTYESLNIDKGSCLSGEISEQKELNVSKKELEDVECKNGDPEAFSDRVESNKQNKQEDFVSDVNRKQILLQRELDNALQNLNTLSRHSQTVSALSMIPFLVLFVSFIIAFYPFFANVTATTTFFLNN